MPATAAPRHAAAVPRTMVPSVGLLYPAYSAEDDFLSLEERLGGAVRLPLVHTTGDDAHQVDSLLDLGGPARLAAGAAALAAHAPHAVMWACTSGSFVFGWDGAHAQADALATAAGRPASSTSLAFVAAVAALGLRRVAVAASYPADVAAHFVALLERGGCEVVSVGAHGIASGAQVGTLDRGQVLDLVLGGDHPDAEAVLVPDTAMHTLAWVEEMEERLGKPVLTANQVTVWEGLRIGGAPTVLPGLGVLLRDSAGRAAGVTGPAASSLGWLR